MVTGGVTIRTPDRRLRVFVSSTLGELAPERAAVRAAIESLRLTPVMFELGARPHPLGTSTGPTSRRATCSWACTPSATAGSALVPDIASDLASAQPRSDAELSDTFDLLDETLAALEPALAH